MSLHEIGMSFHSPLRFLLATVIHCGWYSHASTQSCATRRWISPISFLRSVSRAAFLYWS